MNTETNQRSLDSIVRLIVDKIQGMIDSNETQCDYALEVVTGDKCTIHRHVHRTGNARVAHYTAVIPGLATIISFETTPAYDPETLNCVRVISDEWAATFKRDVVTGNFSIGSTRPIYVKDFYNAVLADFPPANRSEKRVLDEMIDHIYEAASRPLWASGRVPGAFSSASVAAELYRVLERKRDEYVKAMFWQKDGHAFALYCRTIGSIYRRAMDAIGDNGYHYMGGAYPKDAVNCDGVLDYTRGNRRVVAQPGSIMFECFLFGSKMEVVEGWGEAARWIESGWFADSDKVLHAM